MRARLLYSYRMNKPISIVIISFYFIFVSDNSMSILTVGFGVGALVGSGVGGMGCGGLGSTGFG